VLAAAAAFAGLDRPVLAETLLCDVQTNWSDPNNWVGGVVPVNGSGTDIALDEASPGHFVFLYAIQDLASPFVLDSLKAVPAGRGFVVQGSPLRFQTIDNAPLISYTYGSASFQSFDIQNTVELAVDTEVHSSGRPNNGPQVSFSGPVSGVGGLTITGGGRVSFGQAATYTGGTHIVSGTLGVTANNVLPTVGSITVSAGSKLDLSTGFGSSSQAVGSIILDGGQINGGTLSANSLDIRSGEIDADLAGPVGLTKTTGGTAVLGLNQAYSPRPPGNFV
jgi:autotransporter-associated beta strand protein